MAQMQRLKQKAARRRPLTMLIARYCSPTAPENAPSLPLARTSLFPNVNNAPPPEKLKPVLLPIIVELLARTVTLVPMDRIPKLLFTDLVFLTIMPIGAPPLGVTAMMPS